MSNAKDEIILRGLKANNLKNIDLNIKKEQITVFTGISVQERVQSSSIRLQQKVEGK